MARILVVDDDRWVARMTSTVLEKRGHTVITARDGEEALKLASENTPELIITDVMMPHVDGWAFVRSLRARHEFAHVPVIFLTALMSDEDRIRGYRLGADDFIAKPFRFEELDLRVTRALRRAQATLTETIDNLGAPSLRGDLAQIGLSSLLILIEMERKTGLLTLRAPQGGPVASVLVREGRIVHARIENMTDPVDAECVYYLLRWGSGEFEFTNCLVEGTDRIGVTTTHLLMEGARLMDEADAGLAIDGLDGGGPATPPPPPAPAAHAEDPDII